MADDDERDVHPDGAPPDGEPRHTQAFDAAEPQPDREPAQRGPIGRADPVTLVAGLLTVALAVYVVVGGSWNLQWVLALGAVGIGVVMLAASIRPRRSR